MSDAPVVRGALEMAFPGIAFDKKGWGTAPCPFHGGTDSLRVNAESGGFKCMSCGEKGSLKKLLEKLGRSDLLPRRVNRGRGDRTNPTGDDARLHGSGLTLAQYAEAKRLPEDFLRGLGVQEIFLQGTPALRIPYLDIAGSELAVRFRLALGCDPRFKWRSGSRPALYGLNRLDEARKAGYAILDEGESDAQTFWLHGEPAFGLPGADSWREEWAAHFDGIDTIYAIVEPDKGGERMKNWLSASALRDRVRVVLFGPHHKDPSSLYVGDPAAFRAHWEAMKQEAVPFAELARREVGEKRAAEWKRCETLAQSSDILAAAQRFVSAHGVVGEARAVKLLYLALTTRCLDRPVSVALKGPSSSGKSHLAGRVAMLHPPEAVYALSAMSERALVYDEEPLAHRFLALYEAAGIKGDFASYLVRSLLSEGRVDYVTVEKTKAGLRPRRIRRDGPTGLLVTTTLIALHAENETRLLSVPVSDTGEQTKLVLKSIAEEAENGRPANDEQAYAPWHSLQRWIVLGDCRVTIPFASDLADLIPPVAVRLRRDFKAILKLIEAHALLHQATRNPDSRGRIVATVDDYRAVRDLVLDLVAEGIEASVPATMIETVEAVRSLSADGKGVSIATVARRLKLDRSAASRRVSAAEARGFLENLERREGRPAQMVLGEPIPVGSTVLPEPEALDTCRRAAGSEDVHTSPSPPCEENGLARSPTNSSPKTSPEGAPFAEPRHGEMTL